MWLLVMLLDDPEDLSSAEERPFLESTAAKWDLGEEDGCCFDICLLDEEEI